MSPIEAYVDVGGAQLYCREVGSGPPVVVIHGGPDFDHTYLLPDLDRLAVGYRLIYYDQRGRGRSRGALRLEETSIDRYVEDLDRLRNALGLDRTALLGHSWGAHVAMYYALRHPERVSRLILLNSVSASHEDLVLMQAERHRRWAPHRERMDALSTSREFLDGDPASVAEYYRLDFAAALAREYLPRLRLEWTREDILRGRAIENKLAEGLYWQPGYDLIPELRRIRAPTLVIHGDDDFIPRESSAHISDAIAGARLVNIRGSGHFSYIDAPGEVRRAIDEFMA
jgi:proline iminopeptidase